MEPRDVDYDSRRNRALAYAGVLGVFLVVALPLAIRSYWADWNWEFMVVGNVAAWVVLLGSLFTANLERLVPTIRIEGRALSSIGLLMLGSGLLAVPYQKQQRQLYESSPGCVDTWEAGSSSPTPCVWMPMRVGGKFSFRTKNRTHRGFELKDTSDVTRRAEFFDTRLLQSTEEGDAVEVQFWRGSIVKVKAHGVTSATTDYPGSSSGFLAGFLALSLVFSGPVLCLALFESFVRPRSQWK